MNELPVDPEMEFSNRSESSESNIDKVIDDQDSESENESVRPDMEEDRADENDGMQPDPELAEIQGTVTVIQKRLKEDTLK